MKKPQWVTLGVAIFLVAAIYRFGRITPLQKLSPVAVQVEAEDVNLIDTLLIMAKRQVTADQLERLKILENSVPSGADKQEKMTGYHRLAHFWKDTANFFHPYAWYEAEGARLENSEKTLTFAARLFLDNLQHEQNPRLIRWEAMQAKDLFERSLRLNPSNDSSKIGLGACYIFGNISSNPMEGIGKIREVLNKDSTNVYALMTLAEGSKITGEYNKAISRLQTITRLQPDNLKAILLMAEMYESTGDYENATNCYKRSLKLVPAGEMKTAIEKRIGELKK